MAKREMMTRTVETTKVVVLCADTVRCEMENQMVEVTGSFSEEKLEKLLKIVKETIETDTLKVLSIVSKETKVQIYGMEVPKFISLATPLDENRNPIKPVSNEESPVE